MWLLVPVPRADTQAGFAMLNTVIAQSFNGCRGGSMTRISSLSSFFLNVPSCSRMAQERLKICLWCALVTRQRWQTDRITILQRLTGLTMMLWARVSNTIGRQFWHQARTGGQLHPGHYAGSRLHARTGNEPGSTVKTTGHGNPSAPVLRQSFDPAHAGGLCRSGGGNQPAVPAFFPWT